MHRVLIGKPEGKRYVPYPIFGMYGRHGYSAYRHLIAAALERLLPEPLLRVAGPVTMETTVLRQKNRLIAHFLQFVADRRHALDVCEDIIPLRDVSVSIRLDKKPKQLYTAPDKRSIDWQWKDGRVHTVLPEINGHQMLVME